MTQELNSQPENTQTINPNINPNNDPNADPNIAPNNVLKAPESTPEKITLWGEIVKGWYWVVFVWRMMGSFGGIRSLLSSIKRTVIMLIKRLLIQLQS